MATGAAKRTATRKASAKKAPAKKSAVKKASAKKSPAKKSAVKKASAKKAPVKLLSGGNPQIPKGDGREPVQAYLDAMPGWKQDIGLALDAVILRTLPDVHQWVRWNSPFYGADAESWFASFHCFDRFVRVTFCQGESLDPLPAGGSKVPGVRYHDVGEHDEIDEAQLASWIEQASRLPGERF